jgi:hypothetical protein
MECIKTMMTVFLKMRGSEIGTAADGYHAAQLGLSNREFIYNVVSSI